MKNTFLRLSPRRWAILVLATITMIVPAFLLHSTAVQAAPPSGRSVISGHLVPALQHHSPLHTSSANRQLQLSIALNLRNKSALEALVRAQSDPHSSLYHQYLTPQQFTAQFSPTEASVRSVVSYLHSQGLQVSSVASNRLLIDASGSLSAVERAFNITIADYALNGSTVYAPTSEPSVPANLSGLVLNISGLDNVAHYHPAKHMAPAAGPGGGYTPTDLRTAYDMNSLISSANGSGQTVAIFELDGYNASDVNTYLSQYSLGSAKYSNVLVDGATNTAGAGAIEVELDMEVVSAIAPGATQKIYIGPNSTTGVNDTYNKIVTDNVAKVTSTSWGLCEASSGTSELSALDNIFLQGSSQGQSFFAASGDSGAYDCNNTSLAVDSPADDPHVVGVGGTNLQLGSGSSYGSESAWSNPNDTQRSPKGSGGGGGYSTYFSKPSYQSGTGVDSNSMRHVPDVSADADPASGYSVYCTVSASGCSSGSAGWIAVGGTSAAAPLWAGVAADVNSYLAGQGKSTLGNVNAELYTLFNTSQTYTAYHDVTSGNNLFYNAGTGYDLATGIGTPDVWNFARDAAGTTGGTNDFSISASPTSLSIAQGGNGTSTISTAVTTGSAGTVSLSASVSPAGPTASLSPTSVTAGGSSTLTVSVGSSVAAGTYTVTVTGTEGSATHTASVTVTVTTSGGGGSITNGGFESGSLSGWTTAGTTSTSTTAHAGSYSGEAGSTSPTNGDSSISQTFTVPSGSGTLSFWYRVTCPDTVTYDWATATLKDNTSNTTSTILAKTCTNNSTWVQVSAGVTASHSYTLTLTSHDDNYAGDATYTLFDDVALSAAATNPVTNPGFETGSFSGWTTAGTASISTTAHAGSYSGEAGSSSATNGDSSISQTFTVPSGSGTLSFWYRVTCPDTVTYDWATATLKDNTSNTTSTILAKTCTNNATWVQVSATVTAGHSYTLTLTSHDDNYAGDATYTLFDDVNVH
ncbi:protease pro-enzyme activation domain-containing protein [Ktedonobacter sp. SOSP1-85]|uniref:protease pro-enzyme activation domain-containing protein n=1 Tax=Ktedonobacter sp. SOSP1-85 TaxID=2778367 RepID=UPI001EEDFC23|nr:protease pro-enzyme activation domain-containing protein [Ktedonobacter sp. SOSP1-85]